MKLSFFLDYIKRCQTELSKLSERESIPKAYLWYDFIICSSVHGAILNHYCRGKLYAAKGCERRKALTYRRILKAYNNCNSAEGIRILNNKHLFNSHFSKFIHRHWLYSQEMDFTAFSALCDKSQALIIKPEDGVEGGGIYKILPPGDLDDRRKAFDEFRQNSVMIEECIKQHPDMIYNNASVNTIRAHSIIDRDGKVHLLKMLLRVGVGDSVVDNYANGGCVYELDTDTGHIISPSLKKDGSEVYIHPGTDKFMLGRRVPNWDKVKRVVKEAHLLLPQCQFIGWDVAVSDNGIELIEGNHNPDYELLEFFGTTGWWKIIKKYIQ